MDLISALSPGPREHIALVGGGGKTTLMRALAEELSARGSRVVAATTTKVARQEAVASPFLAWCNSGLEPCLRLVRESLQQYSWVFVGTRSADPDKVGGIDPETATALFRDPGIDYVIVEADGASGRPVKVPAEHEPVIPRSATITIALLGLDGLGKALGPDIAFRFERIQKLTGLRPGAPLSVEALSRLFGRNQGLFRGSPEGARNVAFLNKLDVLREPGIAHRLAASILRRSDARIERVVLGSLNQNTYRLLEGRG